MPYEVSAHKILIGLMLMIKIIFCRALVSTLSIYFLKFTVKSHIPVIRIDQCMLIFYIRELAVFSWKR